VCDEELIARARHGDAAAFGELVDRHRSAVYRAALAALGSHADAEDAAQDAFLLAYRRLDSFRGDAAFKTWLLAIAWRQAINRRRGLARMWQRMVAPAWTGGLVEPVEPDAISTVPDGRATPERMASDRELGRAIRHEIRSLPSKLRDALLLAQSGAYSYEEIGAMLGAPVGTIKWRVSEARRVIKLRLAARGHGGWAHGR
jgi:RNA polymerase sigma-70 factor, ECF subfamily